MVLQVLFDMSFDMSWAVPSCHGFAFRDCFPQSRLFESWCKWFQWCRLSRQRSPLHCNALQGFLSKDVLASCSFDLYLFILYVWCSPPGFSLLLQYLVPFRAAASHVKIYQTSNMKESGSMTFWGLQYYTVILATYLLQIFGLIV